MTSEKAQQIWDTYTNGYSELLCTPVEDFDDSLDEGIKSILASVIREVVMEVVLPYMQYAEWEIVNKIMEDINELADELEAL